MRRFRPSGTARVRRRTILRLLGVAALSSALGPALRSAAAKTNSTARGRVIVIGAGMAGLACGHDLQQRGFEVIILEGRDRPGGRIRTDRSMGSPIELGANWIEGIRGNPITELAGQFGVRHKLDDADDLLAYDYDGRPLAENELAEISAGAEELVGSLEELIESLGRDISVGEAIRRVMEGERLTAFENRALDWVISSALESSAAADVGELSSLFEDDEFPGNDHLVTGGYDGIARGIAGGLDVRYGHRASGVAVRRGGATVTLEQWNEVSSCAAACHISRSGPSGQTETIDADAVVVTVPLGILQAGDIAFDPPLSAKRLSALNRLRMGDANKVVLKFPSVVWPRATRYFGYLAETRGDFPVFLNLSAFTGAPILSAYLSGRSAREIEDLTNEQAADRAMGVLRTMLGSKLPDPEGVLVSRWRSDHFTRGSYTFVPVGSKGRDIADLALSEGARLFFAGEHTERRYPATVHGAILSGRRAAREASRALEQASS